MRERKRRHEYKEESRAEKERKAEMAKEARRSVLDLTLCRHNLAFIGDCHRHNFTSLATSSKTLNTGQQSLSFQKKNIINLNVVTIIYYLLLGREFS